MFTIFVVEDEEKEYSHLQQLIQRFQSLHKVEIKLVHFADPVVFLNCYHKDADCVFMDIQLPHMNGMMASKQLREKDKRVPLVFITNYVQYAIEGYAVQALDYILKPMNYYSLEAILLKLLEMKKESEEAYLIFKNRDDITKIEFDKITYIEVEKHKIKIHTLDQVYTTWGTMKDFIAKVPESFTLCNQSFLVNLKHVQSIQGNDVMVGNDRLAISRNRKAEFLNCFAAYLGAHY